MAIEDAVTGWTLETAGPDVLVIAEDAERAAAEDGVAAMRGRLLGRVVWSEARARLAQQGSVAVLLAEARGADDATIAAVLPAIEALARSGDARVVVTMDREQIDLIAAGLTAPGIELLCMPSAGERVAALCVAGLPGGAAVHDIGREAEAGRLRRLNEEIARIAETLARLTRGEDVRGGDVHGVANGAAVNARTTTYRGPPPAAEPGDIAARDIREAIRARRLRDQFFGNGLFEDPAWDMLLDLFAAELERAQVSVSSLCIAAAVAPTTALRWIARMTEAGLFERQPDPFDRRRAFMALSERASAGMRGYVAAVRRTGAAIA